MASSPKSRKTDADRVERAYRSTSGKSKKKSASKQHKRNVTLIVITLVVVIAAVAAGFFLFWEKDNKLILPNVSVAGVDVGNMSKEDAVLAVQQATKYTYAQNNMVVKVNEHQPSVSIHRR